MSKIVRNLTPGNQVSITSPNGGDVFGPDGARVAQIAAGETRVVNAPGASMVLIDDAATVRELGPRGEGGGGAGYEMASYTRLEQRGNYVFEAWYDRLDYREAGAWMEQHAPALAGGCSAVARNGYFGRNFDWLYDDSAVLVVHTPAANGYNAVVGVCGEVPGLTRAAALAGERSEVFQVAPFLLVDGGNDKGLCVSTNVVPRNAYGDNSRVTVDPAAPSVCTLEVVRYILDHFSTVDAAAAWFTSTNFFHPAKLIEAGYEQHWLVSDGLDTAAFEFINGVATVVELESGSTMLTNFHMHGVTLNDDGSVYTPATQDDEHDAVTTNGVHELGCGLERWNIINAGLTDAGSKEGMVALLKTLNFTGAYAGHDGTATPRWDTEFVGIDGLTCDTPSADFDAVQTAAGAAFAERERGDGKTWQTVHSSVYISSSKSLTLLAQEEGTEYEFSL